MQARVLAVVLATAAMAILPALAGATSATVQLTGQNGDGSFNDRLDCAEAGAGDTWRYFWQDQLASDATGVLAGRWNGDFEVHRGLGRETAFVPSGDGRLALTLTSSGGRAGAAFFDTAGTGACDAAGLTLTGVDPSDPSAQRVGGSLPIVATGGLGALRGLTGSGTIAFTLDLTPGADNAASIATSADLDVLDPAVTIGAASARWDGLSNYLARKLRVSVTLPNGAAGGDAFDVKIAGASSGSFEGLPTAGATVAHGASTTQSFVLRNASPGHTYTVGVSVALKDGLLAPQPPVTGSIKFKAPLLP